jgi:hypothetical protein
LTGFGFGSAGCTHNYYYGNAVPVCGPAPAAAVPNGSVCEVPTQVVGGGALVTQGPVRSTIVSDGARPPRVVVSEPSDGSRFGWRPSDPDTSLATTRTEGGLDDQTINR